MAVVLDANKKLKKYLYPHSMDTPQPKIQFSL